MYKFVLEGEVACKKNSVKFNSRTMRTFKTRRFQDWHDAAIRQVIAQETPSVPVRRYTASFTLFHGTMRRVDSDNQVTSLLDLLQDAGVVHDDCWTCCSEKVIHDVFRKGKPGAEIVITPIDNN